MRYGAAAAATGLLTVEGGAEVPWREKKHGRGHVHHHTYYEAAGSAPDSLNGLARDKGLAFGSCLGTAAKKTLKLGGRPAAKKSDKPEKAGFDDPQLRALFIAQCGILVPENEMKWYVLRDGPRSYDFSRADMLVAFADRYQMAVRGHTLLWNRSVWMPEWLTKFDFGPNPAVTAEKLLKDHIKTVCQRYGDKIFSYDVVNETIAPATGEFEESPFTKILGPEVVDLAFRAAREAAPKAQLVYNDYMSWSPKDATHRAGVLKLLERLKKNNVPVDALGIQAHIGSNGMGTATGLVGDADVAEWRKFLDAVTAMGLDLVITEFDVNDKYVSGTPAERDRVVADYAKAYLDIVLSYPQTRYVMAWGLSDKYSWLQKTSPRPDGLAKRVLPYDENFRPKPLRNAIAEAFAAAPARPLLSMKPA
jgi:Beta-1,4-xylanase